jgi:hypothetical protein
MGAKCPKEARSLPELQAAMTQRPAHPHSEHQPDEQSEGRGTAETPLQISNQKGVCKRVAGASG